MKAVPILVRLTLVLVFVIAVFFVLHTEFKQRKWHRSAKSVLIMTGSNSSIEAKLMTHQIPIGIVAESPTTSNATDSQMLNVPVALVAVNPRLTFENDDSAKKSPKSAVCILIPVCSSGQAWSNIHDTFLLKYPLPSIPKTCEPLKFNYSVYIGYDVGDSFFENEAHQKDLFAWTQANIPFASTKLVSFVNEAKKPGPIMNFLSRTAYNDGCDFMYRINDDTELLNPWTSAFVEALQQMDPPLRGVVGPTCGQGNTGILTHDFVHRGHLDVFGTHYPPELTDWWLDDWITLVYGPARTRKLPKVEVNHHVVATRYQVKWENQGVLKRLLEAGQARLGHLQGPLKLVSYSLYGDSPRYLDGALANAKLVKEVMPGWTMRVYHDASVPAATLAFLREQGAQLVDMTGDPLANQMAWRFLPAADPTVARFTSRDIDSRLSAREAAAVREWEASGLPFHVLRDHPSHNNFRVSGGMWGATGGALPDLRDRLLGAHLDGAYLTDMNFLNGHVWPLMTAAGVMVHDAFACDRATTRPFPTPRDGVEHVGSVYLEGKVRQVDADILLAAEAAHKCFRR